MCEYDRYLWNGDGVVEHDERLHARAVTLPTSQATELFGEGLDQRAPLTLCITMGNERDRSV